MENKIECMLDDIIAVYERDTGKPSNPESMIVELILMKHADLVGKGVLYYGGLRMVESYKRTLDEILMVCLAFDYSNHDNGEKTLKSIRAMVDKQLIDRRAE